LALAGTLTWKRAYLEVSLGIGRLVADGARVLRYDNEAGKDDHKHLGDTEIDYSILEEKMLKFIRATCLFLIFITTAIAGESAYTQSAFDQLQKQGQPILVFVYAGWCPTCRTQDPMISKLLKQPPYENITGLRVDFDQQKPVVKAFKVSMQSTLIVFKAGKEVGRSTGDTSEAGIEALLKKAL
jgi:thiol-disulfide isomerase/thioredoxin